MTVQFKQLLARIYSIALVVFLLPAFIADAQKYLVDVITLNNGNIYKGLIVEQPDSDIIRLNTFCHSTLNFSLNEIASVSSEKLNLRRSGMELPFSFEPKGYINITDFGVLTATGNNNQNAIFSVASFNGYSFASRFIAGAGIGIELFETVMLPLYADTRVILAKSRITPFALLKSGYTFAMEDPEGYWGESYDSHGGFMLGAGVGTFIWVSDRSSFEINLLYRFQSIRTERTYEWSGETSMITTRYNRLELRFGLLFQ
jgi:hypothetical protein